MSWIERAAKAILDNLEDIEGESGAISQANQSSDAGEQNAIERIACIIREEMNADAY